VSYPGAQADRVVLIAPGTGRRQERRYIDIISYLPNKFTTLQENKGKFSLAQTQKDIDELQKYKNSDGHKNGILSFIDRFEKSAPKTLKIGVGFWANSRFSVSDLKDLDIKDLDYFVYLTSDRKEWHIWNTGNGDMFKTMKGTINIPTTFEIVKPIEKSDLFFSDIISDEDINEKNKYFSHLPVYSLQAVATAFREQQKPKLLGWKRISSGRKFNEHMFVAQVVGKSMEPGIPDGSYCIFRYDQGGSRNGKVVLVESRQVTDPETNQKFTIKRYRSEKEKLEGDQWRHKKIILSPDNKAFKDIVLENVSGDDFKVVAEFICVL
jgi:hypothetical protein